MWPVLFSISGFPIHTYGAAVGLALLICVFAGVYRGVKEGLPADYLWDVALIVLFGGIGGSRLEFVRVHWIDFQQEPLQILNLRDGGLVFYGGFITVILGMSLYLYWRKLSVLQVLDIYAPLVPLGHAIGRLGCLAAGCCYGRPTELPWGIVFPEGSLAPAGIPLHPTQLYEALTNLLLGIGLLSLHAHRRYTGQTFATLLVGYAFFRFINEFFSGDAARGFAIAGLSNAQLTALLLASIGGLIMGWKRLRHTEPQG